MMNSLEFRAMGCQMLAILEGSPQRAKRILARAPQWFEVWENCLSRFRPDSELNQVNRRPGEAIPVSAIFWSVMQQAQRAEIESAGLVTPTLLGALLAAGYQSSFDEMKADQMQNLLGVGTPVTSLGKVEMDDWKHTIRLPPGVQLDFGGVAKGWAAHQAAQRLDMYGPALVDAGGDIAISRSQLSGDPWLVGIEDPRDPSRRLGMVQIRRGGVATSGKDYRRWQIAGQWKHHIIDPRTGEPAMTDLLTVTIIAPDVMQAEMAAKVVLILGSGPGIAWLEARPQYAGLMVTEDEHILTSKNFSRYWMRDQ
ncbi:MAG: FAD:protein FMN transferase [Anaerolineales bacterium]|nr:FAD:protein FMN transferase [Anaerolineales bacterium]